MYKIKLGADIGKVVDLQPIYFDLGKATVRPDAKIELDKIKNNVDDFITNKVRRCKENK